MGQKLSDLRGYMLTMEGDNNEENGSDGVVLDGKNGNVLQDFDDIYGTLSEASGAVEEVNGNDVHGEECTAPDAPCTCGTSKTRGCRKKDEAGTSKRTNRNSATVKKSRPKRGKDTNSAKKKPNWGIRLNCARTKSDADLPDGARDGCVCTGYKRTDPPLPSTSREEGCSRNSRTDDGCPCGRHRCNSSPQGPAIDLALFNPEDFPMEDADERARLERAREMAEGVDPPPGFVPHPRGWVNVPGVNLEHLEGLEGIAAFFQARMGLEPRVALSALSQIDLLPAPTRLHSQADFIHCLVPDLAEITRCSYYWGKMDRYEAERLLEGRPEGTFLLRDSAQEEHLFSVSFRKYDRSLHARIEQWNHKFSFDSHDPGVFSSSTVVGLIEHYKDPSFCMFFEPMLTIPLHRTFPFPLQHLCRAVICSSTNYDAVNRLPLPRSLKHYLREYHYRQRLRIRYLDYDI